MALGMDSVSLHGMHEVILITAIMIIVAALMAMAPLVYIIRKRILPWQYTFPALSFMAYNLAIAILGVLSLSEQVTLPEHVLSLAATVDILWAASSIAVASVFIAARKLKIEVDWIGR